LDIKSKRSCKIPAKNIPTFPTDFQYIPRTMLAKDILAEYAVRKKRESFKKRKTSLVKKTEQLKRV